LKRLRSKQAIALAMQGRWHEAIAANKSILESFLHDVDAYNRLGRAYMELGEYPLAREAYNRAVELDPCNAIAAKNLQRLSHLGETVAGDRGDSYHVEPQHFIEEMGKAEVVNLRHLAPPAVLVRMVAGVTVKLRIDGTNLVVESGRGEYLGQVEPKHAQRLIKLMQGGNEYLAAVVSSGEAKLTIIIREVYQHPSQAGQLSFPPREVGKLQPYVSGRILRHELEEGVLLGESPDVYDEVNNEE
ncbi:tetratricopeptide repeat protein, partial [Chloroflexota bacterium]